MVLQNICLGRIIPFWIQICLFKSQWLNQSIYLPYCVEAKWVLCSGHFTCNFWNQNYNYYLDLTFYFKRSRWQSVIDGSDNSMTVPCFCQNHRYLIDDRHICVVPIPVWVNRANDPLVWARFDHAPSGIPFVMMNILAERYIEAL